MTDSPLQSPLLCALKSCFLEQIPHPSPFSPTFQRNPCHVHDSWMILNFQLNKDLKYKRHTLLCLWEWLQRRLSNWARPILKETISSSRLSKGQQCQRRKVSVHTTCPSERALMSATSFQYDLNISGFAGSSRPLAPIWWGIQCLGVGRCQFLCPFGTQTATSGILSS